jgi:hypothetical protein
MSKGIKSVVRIKTGEGLKEREREREKRRKDGGQFNFLGPVVL